MQVTQPAPLFSIQGLTAQELDLIGGMLRKGPHEVVDDLLQKIRAQYFEQAKALGLIQDPAATPPADQTPEGQEAPTDKAASVH